MKILKIAPRVVTEFSGKKYIEKERQDKIDVPVEYVEVRSLNYY